MMITPQERAIYLKELSQRVRDLVDILEAYFMEPIKIDKKLNEFYRDCIDEIENLLKHNDYESLRQYKKPFRNLLTSDSEMLDTQSTPQKAIAGVKAYLGEVEEEKRVLRSVNIDVNFENNTLCEYLAKVEKSKQNNNGSIQNENRKLISKQNGDFFYEDMRIEMSKSTLYYDLLDILYTRANQEGFVSYSEIEKELQKRGKSEETDRDRSIKRINNAIDSLSRFAKVRGNAFKNKDSNGNLIITIDRGKGLIFHNYR